MTYRNYSAIAVDNTVGTAMTSTSTSLVLNSSPVGYPTVPFVVAVDYNSAAEELVLVTAVSGTTLTVTRGFNGTTGQAHAVGAVVRHVITAQDMVDATTHYGTALTAGAHGVTGALATFLATPSSANLSGLLTDETGSGPAVFATGPTITSPTFTGTVTAGGNTGAAGQALTSTGSGIAWLSGVPVNNSTQTSSYTLLASDVYTLVQMNSTSVMTLTVPSGVFTAGQYICIQAINSGVVTVAAGSGVTITSTGATASAPKLRVQYSSAAILCTGTNTFTVLGDIQ